MALVMAVVLAGCNGSSESGGPGPEPGKETAKGGVVITDMCKQIPPEKVAEIIGKSIVYTENQNQADYCAYYTEYSESFYKLPNGSSQPGGNFVSLNYENLSVENQRKGHEVMDHKMETNSKISMEHFIATQEKDGLINTVLLIFDDSHFVSINRSSVKVLSETAVVDFASEIAKILKKL